MSIKLKFKGFVSEADLCIQKKNNQANNQQSGQCIVFLMGFSKHSGSSKADYLLAAKPYNNFNPIVSLIALLSWMSCWSPCRSHTHAYPVLGLDVSDAKYSKND